MTSRIGRKIKRKERLKEMKEKLAESKAKRSKYFKKQQETEK